MNQRSDNSRTVVIGCGLTLVVLLALGGCVAMVNALAPTSPAPVPTRFISKSPTPLESGDDEANDAVMRTMKPTKTATPTRTATRRPTPKPTRRTTTAPAVRTVTPGAYCSPRGAVGRANGRTYTCKGPGSTRWRR